MTALPAWGRLPGLTPQLSLKLPRGENGARTGPQIWCSRRDQCGPGQGGLRKPAPMLVAPSQSFALERWFPGCAKHTESLLTCYSRLSACFPLL